jgi:hypothetical protein
VTIDSDSTEHSIEYGIAVRGAIPPPHAWFLTYEDVATDLAYRNTLLGHEAGTLKLVERDVVIESTPWAPVDHPVSGHGTQFGFEPVDSYIEYGICFDGGKTSRAWWTAHYDEHMRTLARFNRIITGRTAAGVQRNIVFTRGVPRTAVKPPTPETNGQTE